MKYTKNIFFMVLFIFVLLISVLPAEEDVGSINFMGTEISTGDPYIFVFGSLGIPDHITGFRKNTVKEDCFDLFYNKSKIAFRIKSEENLVTKILKNTIYKPLTANNVQETTLKSSYDINIDGNKIICGLPFASLLNVMGVPDSIRFMRSKEAVSDYLLFNYESKNLKFHINNIDNSIDGILIETPDININNLKIKVGDPYKKVDELLGAYDTQYDTERCFWGKGVYFGVDKKDQIVHIFITKPNKKSTDVIQGLIMNLRKT